MHVYVKSDSPPVYAVHHPDRPEGEPFSDGDVAYVWAWLDTKERRWHWYCRWHRNLTCADVEAVKAYREEHGESRYYEDQHTG